MVKKSVRARRLEWTRDESYRKGERWVGAIDGRELATVVALSQAWGGSVGYTLDMGALYTSGEASNVESGKRAAQGALSKAVRTLTAEPGA
ncbi:hypothetical protein [Streptomyces sp. NPDC088752]|uniref:hypothetical protein n=1 Tax=Streptomyces sp. NPDC088752 TaxID=3154963 RepID=UPI003439EEEC